MRRNLRFWTRFTWENMEVELIVVAVFLVMGVVTGGADSFLSKTKARSVDAFLSRWTKVIAIGFFVLVLVANAVMYFVK